MVRRRRGRELGVAPSWCVFEPRRQVDLAGDSLEGEEGADEEDDVRRGVHLEGSEGGGAG